MSDFDSEDSQCRGSLDLESNIPHYSLVDSTINLTPINSRDDDWSLDTTHRRSPPCFSTTKCFSAEQNPIRRGVITNNKISGTAPNTGMPVCYAPPVETGPRNKWVELLDSPILTTSQTNPWSPFQYGGIEVERAKKSTYHNLIN